MTPLAIGTGLAILAIIGLVIGLVVFGVVVFLLNATLSSLLKILADVQDAQTAPMLEHGVKGTDQLGRTHSLRSPFRHWRSPTCRSSVCRSTPRCKEKSSPNGAMPPEVQGGADDRLFDRPCDVRQPVGVAVHADRRLCRAAGRHLWGIWVSGKKVVVHTGTTYLLKNTRDSGDELVEELGHHG